MILSIELVKRLSAEFQVVLYTPHDEAFRYFYKDEIPIFKVMPLYTWHLELDTIAQFRFSDGFHGFRLKAHEDLYLRTWKVFEKYPALYRLAKNQQKYYLICRFGQLQGWTRQTFPMRCLGYE